MVDQSERAVGVEGAPGMAGKADDAELLGRMGFVIGGLSPRMAGNSLRKPYLCQTQ